MELGRMNSRRIGTRIRKRKLAIEKDTSNLPCDVIYEILSALPVKSLLRFRCVCKPWRDAISDPKFCEDHLIRATILDRQKVFVSSSNSACFYSIDYYSDSSSQLSVQKLQFPIKKYSDAEVIGSCNGLVVMTHPGSGMLILWNPSTRDYKKFHCTYIQDATLNSLSGLCYDHSSDDYIMVFSTSSGNNLQINLFYIKSNTLKVIREFPYSVKHRQIGVVVNGSLHWDVWAKDDFMKRAIVYLHLGELKFKELPIPNWNHEFHLFSMGGCLCLYYNRYDNNILIWIMKEYGVKGSWTWFSISIPTFPESSNFKYPNRLWFTNKVECVTAIGPKDIVMYNRINNSYKNVPINGDLGSWRAVTFLDCPTLPGRDNPRKRQRSSQQR